MVERAHGNSRGLARCLPGELHPPRRRLCKDGATSATRDRSRYRAEMVPLKRRGCRARSLEAYCRRGLVVSRRTMDVRFHLASVPDRDRRWLQPDRRVTQRANFITDRFVPKTTHTGSTADGRRLEDSSPTGRDLRPPSQPSRTARKTTRIQAEMGLTRSPEGEPEPRRPGTIATGPWGVGTVLGLVIGGHRGRREATAIPIELRFNRVGRGLISRDGL